MSDVESPHPVSTVPLPCVGILLAAGEGQRFAQQMPGADKLLARLADGRYVAETSATNLHRAVDWVLAVVRPGKPALRACLEMSGCHVLETEQARQGMGASLAAAAHYLQARNPEHLPAVVVALADMPWICPDTYEKVKAALHDAPVAVPVRHGRRGHPVGFRASCLPELAALSGDQGARGLFDRYPVQWVDVNDDSVLHDIDVPADLAGLPGAR
ncbi:MAG: nucleotidyltransferase family protein [Corticimicrobacter sp.]|uniref:nucleotidyltransferase family protein n=1 Tax=Corticimicrobacter sp. TaxID=2678536 RepID=UPI0032DB9E13